MLVEKGGVATRTPLFYSHLYTEKLVPCVLITFRNRDVIEVPVKLYFYPITGSMNSRLTGWFLMCSTSNFTCNNKYNLNNNKHLRKFSEFDDASDGVALLGTPLPQLKLHP